jgi:hypothetical protein
MKCGGNENGVAKISAKNLAAGGGGGIGGVDSKIAAAACMAAMEAS